MWWKCMERLARQTCPHTKLICDVITIVKRREEKLSLSIHSQPSRGCNNIDENETDESEMDGNGLKRGIMHILISLQVRSQGLMIFVSSCHGSQRVRCDSTDADSVQDSEQTRPRVIILVFILVLLCTPKRTETSCDWDYLPLQLSFPPLPQGTYRVPTYQLADFEEKVKVPKTKKGIKRFAFEKNPEQKSRRGREWEKGQKRQMKRCHHASSPEE